MALSTRKQVEDFAEQVTTCADAIHERLMRAIKNKQISQSDAQSMFQDEAILRQRANSMYIDAANYVVKGLEESQKRLLEVIEAASEKIRTIKKIATFIELVGDLLILAAAVSAGKAGPILAALKEMKDDLDV